MIKKVHPRAVYIFLIFTIVNIAYRASDLPSYNATIINKADIIKIFQIQHKIPSGDNSLWDLKANLIAWISMNNFLIRLLCLVVPIGISAISLVLILSSSNIDRIIMR